MQAQVDELLDGMQPGDHVNLLDAHEQAQVDELLEGMQPGDHVNLFDVDEQGNQQFLDFMAEFAP